MLTKHKRTHYILVKQWDRGEIKRIPITKAQYDLYEEELQTKKHNDFFKIHDIDTQEVVYNWRASKIEGFEEIKTDPTLSNRKVICEYGSHHNFIWFPSNCDCSHKFWVIPVIFKDRLREMWYIINASANITEEMQIKFLKNEQNGNKAT